MECCLCRTDVRSSKKRRKLHGSSCESAREALLEELNGLALEDFQETGSGAWLCSHCYKLLIDYKKQKDDITSKVSSLTQIRKRQSSTAAPPAKRPCMQQETVTPVQPPTPPARCISLSLPPVKKQSWQACSP